MGLLNLRSANRAVAGGEPGPEGAITKLVLSEIGHEAAAILNALSGPDAAFLDGAGAMAGMLVLMHRAMSIAGGTSEIKRNQIGERILGLPRDPLINRPDDQRALRREVATGDVSWVRLAPRSSRVEPVAAHEWQECVQRCLPIDATDRRNARDRRTRCHASCDELRDVS